jgi:transposase
MEYYVGLDVSLKQTSICVVDQTGSVVRESVVDSDPEAISVYVRSKAPGAVRIGPETGRRLPGYGQRLSDLACQ